MTLDFFFCLPTQKQSRNTVAAHFKGPPIYHFSSDTFYELIKDQNVWCLGAGDAKLRRSWFERNLLQLEYFFQSKSTNTENCNHHDNLQQGKHLKMYMSKGKRKICFFFLLICINQIFAITALRTSHVNNCSHKQCHRHSRAYQTAAHTVVYKQEHKQGKMIG